MIGPETPRAHRFRLRRGVDPRFGAPSDRRSAEGGVAGNRFFFFFFFFFFFSEEKKGGN